MPETSVVLAGICGVIMLAGQATAAGRTASTTSGSSAGSSTAAGAFAAEDQTPSGKFTTATEIKPILNATKANWVALREWDGQDLLYFTHLLAWRCGLHAVAYSVNGSEEQLFPLEPCYMDTAQPNAIKAEDILPYVTMDIGSAQSVSVRVIFDDNSEETIEMSRGDILMN